VLEAAGTKWNFPAFPSRPRRRHCIGVDPYYLTHKAQQIGYHPDMILAGRRINDGMGSHVARRVVKLMRQRNQDMTRARVLILGLAFKENCPDLRNTKVVDIIRELNCYNAKVDVHDPWVNVEHARSEYGVDLIAEPETGQYDAVVLAVAHGEFVAWVRIGSEVLGTPGRSCSTSSAPCRAPASTAACSHMRVLVTGAAGFIGAKLSEVLLARGDEVLASTTSTPTTIRA
jgi:UDP-N-acetyl-D-galactosamine dehydrogenase